MKKVRWIYLLMVLYLAVLWNGCGAGGPTQEVLGTENTYVPTPAEVTTEATAAPTDTPVPTETPIPTPTPFAEYDINLMMVGDNLMHMGIVSTGALENGSYNYDFLFEGIAEFLDAAELKMINQETILGGNEEGFSGYPNFNSPTEVGDAIAAAGFNVVLHASNHTADMKVSGMVNCVEFWKNYPEVLMVGVHDKEDTKAVAEEKADEEVIAGGRDIPVIEVEGVSFAVLNYTYGPNLGSLPVAYEGYLDMLCAYDARTRLIDFTTLNEQVLVDIEKAGQVSDVVIVCPHWGTEYTTKVSGYQEKFAMQMVEAGADIIIGTHPHVVQPVEWIEAENGNKALCFYSLGNYVSTQKQALCMLEAMAWVTLRVTEGGVVLVEEDTGVLPMVCHYNAMPVRFESVYLLEDYTEEQAAAHGIRNYGGVTLVLGDLQKWSAEVFGEWVLTREDVMQ